MHQFDGQEAELKWLPCPASAWCGAFRDRFASSVINARAAYQLFNNAGGLIFRMSPPAYNRIFCSWAADGGTMEKVCEPPGESQYCLPGCWIEVPNWCTPVRNWQCAFKPNELGAMMRMYETTNANHYNEVILDANWYVQHLPDSLEAMFIKDINDQDTRRSHAQFLERYPGADVPLLLYTGNLAEPFVQL